MNKASLNKFASRLKIGGLLVMNSSLIDTEPQLQGTSVRVPILQKLRKMGSQIIAVPADKVAVELGSPKSANMVALGAYLQKRGYFTPDAAAQALPDVLAERYHKTLPVNTEALRRGGEFAKARCKS